MASNTISILIQAKDSASSTIRSVSDNIEKSGTQAEKTKKSFSDLKDHTGALVGVMATAGVGAWALTRTIDQGTDAANAYQAAMLGLTTIATYFAQDATKAKEAAQSLANDGLMTVTDAAGGLKNLLASGFSLPEAITLMERFKDSAAFNRQAALGFGQAIVGATEGIKNGNSILVDNAGVTKNLSLILEEAGYSAQDLMKATTDVNIRQALFNGLVKETNPMVGDAAKLTKEYAGEQAKMAAETANTARKFGTALQPALTSVHRAVTPLIGKVGEWIEKNPKLTTGLALATVAVLGSLAGLAALGAGVSLVSTGFMALVGVVKALSAALLLLNLNPIVLAITAATAVIIGIASAQSLFTSNSDRARSAIERQKLAQEALTSANQAAKTAQLELSDALLAQEGANLRVEAAQARLKQATDQYGASSYEARQASYDLKLAQDELSKSNDRVKTSTEGAATAQNNLKAAKDEIVGANNAAANSASYAATQYKTLADRVNAAGQAYRDNNMKEVVNATFSVPVTGNMPRKALGTNFAQGGTTLVGEHGPELVNLPAGARVDPAWKTRADSASGGAGGIQTNIYGNITIETAEAAHAFFSRLDKTQRLAGMGLA